MRPSCRIRGLPALLAVLAVLGGCSTMRFEAVPNIPQPVVAHLPVTIGLYMPVEFSNYVYKGERYGFKWEVSLGAAQSEALGRLLGAMFERVVPVENVALARQADPDIRAVLEPVVEEFSFVTPRDAGTPFYAVSIKYRVSVYTPDGRLAESWPFTGYGIVPSSGVSAQGPLARATEMAMRDAGAKLVVEFREQAIIRNLLPATPAADVLPAPEQEPQAPQAPAAGAGEAGTGGGEAGAPVPAVPESAPEPRESAAPVTETAT